MDTDKSPAAEKRIPFSIGKKIALSFTVILFLFILLGVLITVNVRNMNREASYEVKYQGVEAFLTSKLGERSLDPETGRFNRKLNQNIEVVEDVVSKRKEEALQKEVETRNTIIVLILISFLVSIVAGTLLIRSIIAPLKKMMLSVQKISQGDLEARVEVTTNDEFGTLAASFNQMAAELKKSRHALENQMEFIRQLSLTDPLTGLHNRRGFVSLMEHRMSVALRNKQKVSIIYADMDNLKVLNDKHGHSYGDEALLKVATLLKEVFRRSDILARVGGDEFAIALTDNESGGVEVIRERLLEKMREHNAQKKDPYPIELSLGIVIAEPDSGKDISGLLAEADKLMYEDKRRKKEARK